MQAWGRRQLRVCKLEWELLHLKDLQEKVEAARAKRHTGKLLGVHLCGLWIRCFTC